MTPAPAGRMLGRMENDDYGLALAREGDGLRATVSGARNIDNTIAYWETLLEQILRQRPRWLLVDDRLRGEEVTVGEWFALVERMKGRGLEGIRIAHVKAHGMNHLEYCEIFAREAGLDARAFNDVNAAELWLRYGLPEEHAAN
jgi:hypothetical protein